MNAVSLEAPLSPGSDVAPTKSVMELTAGAFPVSADYESIKNGGPRSPTRLTTSFGEEVVQHLERTSPGVLAWLRTTTGVVFQMLLVFSYVLLETVAGLLKSFVLKPEPQKSNPLPSSIIVMNSGISIVLGFLISSGTALIYDRMSIWRSFSKTFIDVFNWRHILSYSLIATLFSVSGVFSMMAYSKLDAGLKKVLDQLRLPITAALSAVILGKRYSLYEWLALLILLLAICNFYFADMKRDEITDLHMSCRYPPQCFAERPYDLCGIRVDGPTVVGVAVRNGVRSNGTLHRVTSLDVDAVKTNQAGLIFNLVATCLNCIAALCFEKVVKSAASTPFPTQKAQMEITGLPVAIAMSFIVPLWIDSKGGKAIWWERNEAEGSGAGFFQAYEELTWIAIAMDILLAWMSGIIVKQLSSVVRLIAKCFILLLTVLAGGTFLRACHEEVLPLTMYALATITACTTVLFATMPNDASSPSIVAPLAREVSISTGRAPQGATGLHDREVVAR